MSDIYQNTDNWWDEAASRRQRWVDEGKRIEIFPPDCELASALTAGALPFDSTHSDEGKLRVMFLHGLESSALGMKPMYLARWFRVCAPSMIPKRPFLTMRRVCAAIHAFHPHVIVGSSFGGAILLALLQHGEWRGPSILLAPALGLLTPYSLSLPSNLPAPIVLVHGSLDTIVPLAHSRALLNSVASESDAVFDCSGTDSVGSASEVLSRLASCNTSLLITKDVHPLQKLCCEDAESPSVPTLHMIIEAICGRTKDEDMSVWQPTEQSSGFVTALTVCSSILWQFPTHAISRRCCPTSNSEEEEKDLSRVSSEAAAMQDAEMKKKN